MKLGKKLLVAGIAICPTMAFAQSEPVESTTVSKDSDAAQSQDKASTNDVTMLDEIVVTASRRSQSVQATALAITAISGETLEKQGVNDIRDIATITPGLKIGGDAQLGTVPIILRGVGIIDPDGPTQDSPVAVYVDDVYISRPFASVFLLPDVERLEVLRGPQGTLFGRNASGGALQVITRQPDDTFQAAGNFSYGNLNATTARGYVMAPLGGSGWGFKIAAGASYRKGWATNPVSADRFGGENSSIVRGSLRRADSDSELIFQLDHAKSRGRSQFVNVDLAPTQPIDVVTNDQPHDNTSSLTTASVTYKRTLDFADATVNAAYVESKSETNFDSEMTSVDMVNLRNFNQGGKQFSLEGRMASSNQTGVQWILGTYLFSENNTLSGDVRLGPVVTGGAPATAVSLDNESSTRSAAVFGELGYGITDKLEVTGGLRYTYERKALLGKNRVASPVVTVDDSRSWSNVTPRLILRYTAHRNMMAYASITKGFRSGTWSVTASDPEPARPEYIWNYEAGIKSTFMDGRARLNVAMFQMNYEDKQERVVVRPGVTAARNATSAKIKGMEIEYSILPVDSLSITGNLSYLDAKYGRYIGDPSDVGPGESFVYTGNTLPLAPKWKSGLMVAYTFGQTPLGPMTAEVRWNYQSRVFFTRENNPAEGTAAYSTFDAQLSADLNDQWTASLFVNNVSDVRRPIQIQNFNNQGLGTPTSYNLPRTYGVRMAYRF